MQNLSSCQRKLSTLDTDKPRPFERLPCFEKLVFNVRDNQRVKTLRSGEEKPCGCELCRIGSIPPKNNLRGSDGPVESDFFEGPAKEKHVRPSVKNCGICGRKDYVGHDCNAERILNSISDGTCEIIASETIKAKMIRIKSKDVMLKSKFGRPTNITVNNCDHLLPEGSKTPVKPAISSITMMKLKTRLNLSGRKAILAGQIFGEDLKMKLEPHMKNLMIEKAHELDQFYDIIEDVEFESYEFESVEDEEEGTENLNEEGTSKNLLAKGKKLVGKATLAKGKKGEDKKKKSDSKEKKVLKRVKKPFVACNNVEGLVAYVKEKRGYDPEGDDNLLIKLGLDSGRGFLKLCMTMEELEDSEEFVLDQKKKLTHQQKFKDGGVKRLFILAIVENCMENYHNVSVLMNIVGVNTLSFSKSITVDLKMDNLLLGEVSI